MLIGLGIKVREILKCYALKPLCEGVSYPNASWDNRGQADWETSVKCCNMHKATCNINIKFSIYGMLRPLILMHVQVNSQCRIGNRDS